MKEHEETTKEEGFLQASFYNLTQSLMAKYCCAGISTKCNIIALFD